MNSSVNNFVFKCFSTNSNVNGYEVDNLPIPRANTSQIEALAKLAQKCLDAKGVGCDVWEKEIDERLAALYGL